MNAAARYAWDYLKSFNKPFVEETIDLDTYDFTLDNIHDSIQQDIKIKSFSGKSIEEGELDIDLEDLILDF